MVLYYVATIILMTGMYWLGKLRGWKEGHDDVMNTWNEWEEQQKKRRGMFKEAP